MKIRVIAFFVITGMVLCAWCPASYSSRGFKVQLRAAERADAPVVGEVELYAKSHALVIGIDAYRPPWPRLSNAVKDAELVAEALKAQGFEVSLKKNLEGDALKKAFEDFFILEGEGADARLFVWFAGHGYTEGGEGFLVPSDAPGPNTGAQFKYKALSMRRFGELVRLAGAKHALAVFDSCFSGTIFDSKRSAPPPAVTRATTLPVRQFMTSGDADQEVSDDGGFRKLFIRALAGEERADANGDGYLTASELGMFLEDRITNLSRSRQTPRYGKLRDMEWDRGDFVFQVASSGAVVDRVSPQVKTTLKVEGTTAGARVLVDGKDLGRLPTGDIEVSAGKRKVRVEKDGYEAYERVIELGAGRGVTLFVDLTPARARKGRLFVETEPRDARVRIMNIGPSFEQGMELDAGTYDLEITASGYEAKRFGVAVAFGEDKRLSVSLEPMGVEKGPREWRDPVTGMEFVWVPGGCFQMGDTSGDGLPQEKPVHDVCVNAFWMGKYEVTNEQFRKFRSGHDSGSYGIYSLNVDRQPAVHVSWNDAKEFAAWLMVMNGGQLGFRLPTEAEWEYACRAGTRMSRFWGNDPKDACRYGNVADLTAKGQFPNWIVHDCWDAYAVSAPVGSFKPNAFGLHDMLGNVGEWCEDMYAENAYSTHVRNNPIYVDVGPGRVTRGNEWGSYPQYVRCANRSWLGQLNGDFGQGFRLLRFR